MKFVPGDPNKISLRQRGLSFDQISAAPLLDILPNPTYPGQIVLVLNINGYIHAAPCEPTDDLDTWRIITAYPSRRLHKIYQP